MVVDCGCTGDTGRAENDVGYRRALWLFSRNDALTNVAVIVTATLLAWTGKAWPDLAVAAITAMLFLHSAIEILGSTRIELRELRHAA